MSYLRQVGPILNGFEHEVNGSLEVFLTSVEGTQLQNAVTNKDPIYIIIDDGREGLTTISRKELERYKLCEELLKQLHNQTYREKVVEERYPFLKNL